MLNTRGRRITHNDAKISVDQILDLHAGVYFNIICDQPSWNPPLPPLSLYLFSRFLLPNNVEIRQSNKHLHALDVASLSF